MRQKRLLEFLTKKQKSAFFFATRSCSFKAACRFIKRSKEPKQTTASKLLSEKGRNSALLLNKSASDSKPVQSNAKKNY